MVNNKESWHLSKSVPVTLILAITLQTVAMVWFISGLNSQVHQNVLDIKRNETLIERITEDTQRQDVTLGRIEENVSEIRRILESER